MIPNPGCHNSEPQLSFPQQASPPPPLPPGGKARGQPASMHSPSQPGSQGVQASLSTPSQGSTTSE